MQKIEPNSAEYPLGTVALYGPTDMLATKLVAAIFSGPDLSEPNELHRWITQAGDVRHDNSIAQEVAVFFKERGVKKTVLSEEILGCPHEEGIDYPLGKSCPRCPFWADEGQLLEDLSVEDMLEEMGCLPAAREVFEAAEHCRDALIPHLLEALKAGLVYERDAPPEVDDQLICAALLLSKWRVKEAGPLLIQWLMQPDGEDYLSSMDFLMNDGGRMLASVFSNDVAPIKGLIENTRGDEISRSVGISAIAVLTVWGEIPRDEAIAYFAELYDGKLGGDEHVTWAELVCCTADLELKELEPRVREAFREGRVGRPDVDESILDDLVLGNGSMLRDFSERNPPITDVAGEIAKWIPDDINEEESKAWQETMDMIQEEELREIEGLLTPYKAPPKTGRNDPCPCGSGKKFKKCCGK